MAFTKISKAALPVSTFGAGRESKPTVAIGANGQMRFSTKLTADVIGKCDKAVIQFDPDTRELRIMPVLAAPKGWTEDELFVISRGKDGEGKQAYFGASALLSFPDAGIEYDFRASGTQMFDAVIGATKSGNQFFSISIPKGALEPRPVKTRAKAPAASATPVSKAPAADDDEID